MQCACILINGKQLYCCQHQPGKEKKEATQFTILVYAEGSIGGVRSWVKYYANIMNMSKEVFLDKETQLLETFGGEVDNIIDTIDKSFMDGDFLDKAVTDNQVSIVFDAKTSKVSFNKLGLVLRGEIPWNPEEKE